MHCRYVWRRSWHLLPLLSARPAQSQTLKLIMMYLNQGKNWRGLWGLDPPWKTYDPHWKDRKKELGVGLQPPWYDSVVIHETETPTVTFNRQTQTKIVQSLHNSGHVWLSIRYDSRRLCFVHLLTVFVVSCMLSVSVMTVSYTHLTLPTKRIV